MKAVFKQWLRQRVHDRALAGAPPARIPWQYWGYEASENGMFLHGRSLADLVAEFGSPLHVLNVQRLLDNLAGFVRGAAELHPTVCCSVKTYPVPGLLSLLLAQGAQAEVISEHELWLVRQLGVPAAHIVFNGPAKSDAALKWAIEAGVKAIHFNHPEEVARVSALAARLGKRVKVGLRLTSTGVAGQFGFAVADPATWDALRRVLDDPWLEMVSLHGHRGVYMRSAADVRSHVGPMLEFARLARDRWGWSCRMLDVGGSLAIPSVSALDRRASRLAWTFGVPPSAPDPALTLSPAEYSRVVCEEVLAWCKQHRMDVPEVVMEPGRALSGNAQALLSTVLEVRHDQPFSYAVTDVGTAVAPSACHDYHQMGMVHRAQVDGTGAEQVYRVVGPICHLGDVAAPAWQFPPLHRGDVLAMMDAGAYFISDASSFSFHQPGVVAVHADGRVQSIRRVETSADMIHRDI